MILAPFDRTPAWRVIATRIPPIALFENVADPAEFDALQDLETAFNPHHDEGHLVQSLPRGEWVFGPGAGYVMAPFAYRTPSRFSDGTFGIFYAGLDEETAIHEVAFHRGLFMARTGEPPSVVEQLVLRAKVTGDLVDLRGEVAAHPEWYDPDPGQYGPAQVLGGQLRQAGRTGLAFASVRRPGGHCVGILRPQAISACRHSRPFSYYWDGARIAGWR